MHKRIIKYSIGIAICLFLSIITEIIGFNHQAITNNNESIQDVTFTKSHNDNETILELKTDNRYINKLIIEYNSSNDVMKK